MPGLEWYALMWNMSSQHSPEGSPWSRYLFEHRQHTGPVCKLVDTEYSWTGCEVYFYGQQSLTGRQDTLGWLRMEGLEGVIIIYSVDLNVLLILLLFYVWILVFGAVLSVSFSVLFSGKPLFSYLQPSPIHSSVHPQTFICTSSHSIIFFLECPWHPLLNPVPTFSAPLYISFYFLIHLPY